jgi:hypothetical protein
MRTSCRYIECIELFGQVVILKLLVEGNEGICSVAVLTCLHII